MNQTASNAVMTNWTDEWYPQLENLVAKRVASVRGPLFTTNVQGLFDLYLAGIQEQNRQHYNCNCCRRFVERYGGLVTISADGYHNPLLWHWAVDEVPEEMRIILAVLWDKVKAAKVTGVFINEDAVWGTPENIAGPGSKYVGTRWTHLHGTPQEVYKNVLKTANQVEAEKREDYIMLKKGLAETPCDAVVQAIRVLESDAVDRSEKTLPATKWLLDLYGKNNNQLWLAVATAPPGWCHIRSNMIATLLKDVIDGLSFDEIKRRWDAKMHPLAYQRPTALSEGNVKAANVVVEKLSSAGALTRRFTRLHEVTALWRPKTVMPPQPPTGGAFDHLLKPGRGKIKEVELPPKKMVWLEFLPTLLQAESCEVQLASYHLPMFGMVMAADAEAPPILQWDGLEGHPRNSASWYFWNGGSSPSQWGVVVGWNKVSAVCLKPCYWQEPDKFKHQGDGVFFIIDGAVEQQKSRGGFFPEFLRSEYREIRHAMEAHARATEVQGRELGSANGIALQSGNRLSVRLTTGGSVQSCDVTL